MEEIRISDIKGIRIGQVEDVKAGTGLTVVISEKGAACGICVRGGGPASRDIALINPMATDHAINAIILGGGSAYGLDAAGGVMSYLEEKGIGYRIAGAIVPLVCQSDIFDLGIGDSSVRPDKAMGYAACVASEKGNYKDGCFGAGCGASIGKFHTKEYAMKSGIGSFAMRCGELEVGAIAVVNAFGDVYEDGKMIAGLLSEDKKSFRSTVLEMARSSSVPKASIENTTLCIVITNASLSQIEANQVASISDDGIARAVNPTHTSYDGDSVYAMSVGDIKSTVNVVGTLGAIAVEKAIVRAVKASTDAYGLPGLMSL